MPMPLGLGLHTSHWSDKLAGLAQPCLSAEVAALGSRKPAVDPEPGPAWRPPVRTQVAVMGEACEGPPCLACGHQLQPSPVRSWPSGPHAWGRGP